MARGTYADNSTRKCVIYCPLGSFADPTTQICVASIFDLIKPARRCPVCSAVTSLAHAFPSAIGESTPILPRGNAPAFVLLELTETTRLEDVFLLVLRVSPLLQIH